MSTIGTFKANGNEFTGEIATLTIRATLPFATVQRATDAGPSHRIFAGQAEVGDRVTWRFAVGDSRELVIQH